MKLLWVLAAVCCLMGARTGAQADEALLPAAQQAYAKQDLPALQGYAQKMKSRGDILAPYADYWAMLLQLSSARDADVTAFLERYADYPFADRVRGEWLKQLGKRQDWPTYFSELKRFRRSDTAVDCYTLQGQMQQGEAPDADRLRALWLVSADQPGNCSALFDAMFQSGVLKEEDAWRRFRLALQDRKISVAKAVSRYIKGVGPASVKLIDRVHQNPQRVLQRNEISSQTRFNRALSLYALDRLAATQPALALDLWRARMAHFDAEEQSYMWGRLALYAARRHDPAAIKWYALARNTELDGEQQAWRVRAALRDQDWPDVITAIDALSPDDQALAAWRYWKARALKETQQIAAANAILAPLSREHHYYALLAMEELGDTVATPEVVYRPDRDSLRQMAARPGIQRALALQQQGFRWEARAEWAVAIEGMDDQQLIAAAEIALQNDWIDVAINTSEKTRLTHDFALRFPIPYRDMMRTYVRENGLDEAWVYGLIRQESRFIGVAKSSAGASGLMQIMPATAKWIAKRLGMSSYKPAMVTELETNMRFGTHYMRYTLDRMDGQVLMATAAYNAGPGRPRRWSALHPLEGSIYADTIPFSETRDYVKKVMANAYYYAQQMGQAGQSLKQRMGTVPGSAESEESAQSTK